MEISKAFYDDGFKPFKHGIGYPAYVYSEEINGKRFEYSQYFQYDKKHSSGLEGIFKSGLRCSLEYAKKRITNGD